MPLEENTNVKLCNKCRRDNDAEALAVNRQVAQAELQGASFRQATSMVQQGIASSAWLLDERSQKKVALKAGLNSRGPAMQVRIMLMCAGKLQDWKDSVFDRGFLGKWKESLASNVEEARVIGQEMWARGLGEAEFGRTFNQKDTEQTGFIRVFWILSVDDLTNFKLPEPALLVDETTNSSDMTNSRMSRRVAPYSRIVASTHPRTSSSHTSIDSINQSKSTTSLTGATLFASFRASSLAVQNKETMSRMALGVSQSHRFVFKQVEFVKTDFHHKKDGSFFGIQSSLLAGLLASKPFAAGSHKQAFEFRYNEVDLVAKRHFRFDHKELSLATMSKSTNHQLLEMECKKAILVASYLKAFSEELSKVYDKLDLPNLIYTPCFLATLSSTEEETYMVEPDLRPLGKYIKINNTDEFAMPDEEEIEIEDQRLYRFMHAFIHFVFHRSMAGLKTSEAREEAMIVIADIQGFRKKASVSRRGPVDHGEFHLFDLVTHTARGDSSMGDGGAGMLNQFLNQHICGDACKELGLTTAQGHQKSFPRPMKFVSYRHRPWWIVEAQKEHEAKSNKEADRGASAFESIEENAGTQGGNNGEKEIEDTETSSS
ncbi:hypothetical protein TREMEDRAFT_59228 [Tremella mesenterica DSM 1558]|uniref:uncharacterized protein n=1 Tax=Tremella mesenterica (strain ATCC 24925 / CBS 8224 / DSM 1558 / NBRC 9311 / NRRL Y-6157 / RJB 2259-6 / UBC 559-6) TaxID=578456 RepID=UPI0003F4A492|nr:uncharacterized protein TREMEDRAFT_59228 [Tremella mesenterica DSM 1558]EIW73066.1 hypothetical protein TREMEDRAFT_59228 [Tremella mesenterica DSM 1558]